MDTSEPNARVGVHQLRLVVTAEDFEEALRFYRDVLGLVEREAFSSEGGRVGILEAGRATLELADPAHAAFVDQVEVGRRVAGHVRVAFEVDDVANATARLAGAGATVVAEPVRTPWKSLNARLQGPAGLQLTVFEEVDDIAAGSEDESELGFDTPTVVDVEQVDDQNWRVLKPIGYRAARERFDVPVDSPTDFASVPRMFVWLLPRYGRYTKAAILHDYLWRDRVRAGQLSLRDADGIFRQAMRQLGVPFLRRWMMWAAVRIGALKRGGLTADWFAELPRVLLIAVVTLPVVLPPALLVLVGVILFKVLEGIVWIPLKLGSVLGPRLGMKRPPKKVNPPSLSFRL
jgi:predicted enzyme related to lactoylglutathione lyase